jgi:flagellar biosynthesis chaperone FliJ
VKELQKQNELLAAQAERQKAEDAAKAKIEERKKHIDDISGQIAELVNDQGRKNAAILNISYSSQYNDLFNELKTLLNTATSNIEDEEEFRATVEKTSRDWATRKVLQ